MSRFLSCLQHSRPCCIGYTNSRLRLEFVTLLNSVQQFYATVCNTIACILKAHSVTHTQRVEVQSELPLSVNAVFE